MEGELSGHENITHSLSREFLVISPGLMSHEINIPMLVINFEALQLPTQPTLLMVMTCLKTNKAKIE